MSQNGSTASVHFITPPDDLKRKAKTSLSFDENTLKKAEHAVARFLDQHRDWCENELDGFKNFIETLDDHERLNEAEMEVLFKFADSLRNNGGMFGYDLLTEIGKSLCWYLADRNVDSAAMLVIRLHIDGMGVVLSNDLKGEGGLIGKSLMDDLRAVVTAAQQEV